MSPEIAARIDADMTRAAAMDLPELAALLSGYSARFDPEISRGEVLREAIRAYADAALDRARQTEPST